jgi:hypothetical protein
VLAAHDQGDSPMLPTLVVVGFVVAIALAILKAPRADDYP